MKNTIVNSINTNSAGTSNITKLLINEGELVEEETLVIVEDNTFFNSLKSKNIKFINLNKGIKRIFIRLYFELFLFKKLVNQDKPKNIIIMANYSLLPMKTSKKIVLMRHPYLVDRSSWQEIKSYKHYITELVRKVIFKVTLLSTDEVIVQTNAMKKMFLSEYPSYKNDVKVLNNPVSKAILNVREQSIVPKSERVNYLLYPSRYYAHKNHEVLIDFVTQNKKKLIQENLKIVITLHESGEGAHILSSIKKHNIDDFFVNLGEVEQTELHYYYRNSLALFFPSQAETFGNSIAEAMCFGLPIFIANKQYAKSLCGESAFYSDFQVDKIMSELLVFLSDWEAYKEKSRSKADQFLSPQEWFVALNSEL